MSRRIGPSLFQSCSGPSTGFPNSGLRGGIVRLSVFGGRVGVLGQRFTGKNLKAIEFGGWFRFRSLGLLLRGAVLAAVAMTSVAAATPAPSMGAASI